MRERIGRYAVVEFVAHSKVRLRAVSPRGRLWARIEDGTVAGSIYEYPGTGQWKARLSALAEHRAAMPSDRVGLHVRVLIPEGLPEGMVSVRASGACHLIKRVPGAPETGRLFWSVDDRMTLCGRSIFGWKILAREHEARFGWSGSMVGKQCENCRRSLVARANAPRSKP